MPVDDDRGVTRLLPMVSDLLPNDSTIIGIVGSGDGDAHSVWFARSVPCRNRLPLPLELVRAARHLTDIECGEHSHALVRIEFAFPDHATPAARSFVELFSEIQDSDAGRFRVAASECMTVHTGQGIQVCCWVNGEVECTGVALKQ